MKKQLLYLFNGYEIPESLFLELTSFCNLNNIPYRRNDIGEKKPVSDEFFVRCNLQIEVGPFSKFLIDLYERKEFYLQKSLKYEK